jgi:hypothetical protein
MIKLKDILNEVISEMGEMTIQPVLDLYDKNPELVSKAVFPYHELMSKEDVKEELLGMEYTDFIKIRAELDLNPLEEKKEKPGLWANIRAQRARGEKPARKGSKEYKQAVKAAKEINKNK